MILHGNLKKQKIQKWVTSWTVFNVNLVSLFGSGWEGQPEQQLPATQTILFLPKVDHITLTLSPPEEPWRTKAQGGPLMLLVFSYIQGLLVWEVKSLEVWILAEFLYDLYRAMSQISTWLLQSQEKEDTSWLLDFHTCLCTYPIRFMHSWMLFFER